MDFRNSYFSITSPVKILDRWLNPYQYTETVLLREKKCHVNWTKRANKAFKNRAQPLIAEMQLYFSCVIKKRVLFHSHSSVPSMPVNPHLDIIFRTVQSNACSPEEFASNHPVKQDFNSQAARQMHPSQLNIDFKNQQWVASFSI